jgi:hypothetical protein
LPKTPKRCIVLGFFHIYRLDPILTKDVYEA